MRFSKIELTGAKMRSLIVTVFFCLTASPSENPDGNTSVDLLTSRKDAFLRPVNHLAQSAKQTGNKNSGVILQSYAANRRQYGTRCKHNGRRKKRTQPNTGNSRLSKRRRNRRKQPKKRRTTSSRSTDGFWELEDGAGTIICQTAVVGKCPKIKGGGSWREARKAPNLEPGNSNWVIVVKPGVKLICSKENIERCKKIVGGGGWRQSKNPGHGFWKQTHRSTTLYCKAKNINDCPGIHKGEWDFVQKKYINTERPGNAKWIVVLINCTLYCDHEDSKKCAELFKRKPWVGFSSSVEYFWKITSKSVMIICSAAYFKHCPPVKVDAEWEVYNVNVESRQNAKMISVIQLCTLYCNQASAKACNQLYSHVKWYKFNAKKQLTARIVGWWYQKHEGVLIICNADYMKNCPIIHGGTWKSNKKVNVRHPGMAKWIIVLEHCTLYCNQRDIRECNRFTDWNDWKPFPLEGFSKVVTGSVGFWTKNHGYMEILCKADEFKNCAQIRGGGKWELVAYERNWYEHPGLGVMVSLGDNCNIYCGSNDAKTCDEFYRGSWLKIKVNRNPSNGGWWEKTYKNVRIICVARNGYDCPIVTRFGRWKYLKTIQSMEKVPDWRWMVNLNIAKLVCNARNVHKCPQVVGSGSWKKH